MNGRQKKIVELLESENEVSASKLAELFDVTQMTIRRDLAHLERQGYLRRVHGGAVRRQAGLVAFSFAGEGGGQTAQKRAIAREAAKLIQPGTTVMLEAGTTTLEVARELGAVDDLTLLTTSLSIASVLHSYENIRLILLGGEVRRSGPDLVGALTESNLMSFRVDVAVLGADSVSPEGVFAVDTRVGHVARLILVRARRNILVADSSKFSSSAFYRFGGLEDFDFVVTDTGVPSDVRKWLEGKPCDVTYAEPDAWATSSRGHGRNRRPSAGA